MITDHSSTPLELALDVAQLIHVTQYKEMLKTDKNHKFRRKNGKVKVIKNLYHIFSIKIEKTLQLLLILTMQLYSLLNSPKVTSSVGCKRICETHIYIFEFSKLLELKLYILRIS